MLKWLKRRRGARKGYVSFGTALSEIEAALSRAKLDSAQSDQGWRREIPETITDDKDRRVHARAARIEAPGERAWKMLRELLLDGTLPSYIESATGTMVPIGQDFWVGNGSIELREIRRRSKDRFEYSISGQVVMPEKDLAKLLEHASEQKKEVQRNSSGARTGGAPARYDSEAFLIEAFRILYEETPNPKTEAELRKRALDAYAEAGHVGGTPSEDWAGAKIKRLWERLELGLR